MFKVTVLPEGRLLEARGGEKLLEVLRGSVSAPCGGQGKCGKCRVAVDGEEKLACLVNNRYFYSGGTNIDSQSLFRIHVLTGKKSPTLLCIHMYSCIV